MKIKKKKVNQTWIKQRLEDSVSELRKDIHYYPLDKYYWVTSEEDFMKVAKKDKTNMIEYVSEKFDCENFAMLFSARMSYKYHLNSVGIVIDYSSQHAYNIIVFRDGSVKLYEPQEELLIDIDNDYDNYNLENGAVLI